jgi:hypothetical protein
MRARLLLSALALAGLTGCGDEPQPEAPAQPDSAAPAVEEIEEDPRLRAIHGADAVGYDGDAIQRAVRGVQEDAAARQRELEAATPR